LYANRCQLQDGIAIAENSILYAMDALSSGQKTYCCAQVMVEPLHFGGRVSHLGMFATIFAQL